MTGRGVREEGKGSRRRKRDTSKERKGSSPRLGGEEG